MKNIRLFLLIAISLISCRKDEMIMFSESKEVSKDSITGDVIGFYLLNEGNMGMNKASLDYYDYKSGIYKTNIYAETNPTIVKEMGDVGNDLKVYGNKLYAVINNSNRVEVMDLSAKHLASINIPSPRYLTFTDGKAYISSYAGKVTEGKQRGFVVEIDTTTFKEIRRVTVGYQPEEMAVTKGKLYVANSGGYSAPDYDRTVSVVDLTTFKEIKKIDVAINLHRLRLDADGNIYVNSRGNGWDISSSLYLVDTKYDKLDQSFDLGVSQMCIVGDSLYYFDQNSYTNTIRYGIFNMRTKTIVNENLITDGTDRLIKSPYGLAVHSIRREFYITDVRNYVSMGFIYCFSADGTLKWKASGGNIPAHITFLYKKQN